MSIISLRNCWLPLNKDRKYKASRRVSHRIRWRGGKTERDFFRIAWRVGSQHRLHLLILLFQFRSISTPLVVMAAIPMAFPGAAAGLLLFNNPFGFTAFMGIVSLGGIVVRNAIILVDYINARVKEGETLEHAALEAGQRRLRPIFLTTMAAAVGVAPMIISGSSLWSPLASTIAIGLITSMFFTLLVVPCCMCW